MTETVTINKHTLAHALRKARNEYVRVARAQGFDPGPEDECWAEFEALADEAQSGPHVCPRTFKTPCYNHGEYHCLLCCMRAGINE